MGKTLKIGEGFSLPLDTVTQTIAVLAKKRSGKSYFARRFAEQLYAAGQQIVIIDPKGDHWGILSSRDGKGPGLPLVIFGGQHGHVPLEPGSGELVAKVIVTEQVSAVLDLSLLRKGDRATFMAIFMEAFFLLKAQERYRTPVMIIGDEADKLAPQKPQPNEMRMLGATDDMVRLGGQRGIGFTMITQRSAVLNKDLLTQCQVLIALRTIGKRDRDAIDEWIDVHGTPEERKTLMASLPALPVGDAWVWSPGWPTDAGIFKRMHTLPIETFDSFATPKPGERRVQPKKLADVDIKAIREQMAATLERAKADDPTELRKQVADLKRQLAAAQKAKAPPPVPPPPPSPPPVSEQDLVELHALATETEGVAARLKALRARIGKGAGKGASASVIAREVAAHVHPAAFKPASAPRTRSAPQREASKASDSNGTLTGPEQRVLDALAWLESIGVEEPEHAAVAFVAKYAVGASSFKGPRGALRTRGLIHFPQEGFMALTDAGRKLANAPDTPGTTAELHARVIEWLPGPERKLLTPLLKAYPDSMSNQDLAEASGYAMDASSFKGPRGRLRTLALIDFSSPGHLVARDILFPEGAHA